MNKIIVSTLLILIQASAFAGENFPKNPDPILTPGVLCAHPDSQRYKEQINYCNRNVETSLKADIIATYDRERGFKIRSMPRNKFKIDHYIPLCMGGANDRDNLWPQHETVFKVTDELEATLCQKMADGKLLQRDAMLLIKRAKNNLNEARDILDRASRL